MPISVSIKSLATLTKWPFLIRLMPQLAGAVANYVVIDNYSVVCKDHRRVDHQVTASARK